MKTWISTSVLALVAASLSPERSTSIASIRTTRAVARRQIPHGPVFFDFASPCVAIPWGQIPSSLRVQIPDWIATPQPLILQALAHDALNHGNTSNGVEVTIP